MSGRCDSRQSSPAQASAAAALLYEIFATRCGSHPPLRFNSRDASCARGRHRNGLTSHGRLGMMKHVLHVMYHGAAPLAGSAVPPAQGPGGSPAVIQQYAPPIYLHPYDKNHPMAVEEFLAE